MLSTDNASFEAKNIRAGSPDLFMSMLLIFFDFLQSDWLQQRAAFYDILTVVQKCYFLPIDRSEKLSFEVENRQKI